MSYKSFISLICLVMTLSSCTSVGVVSRNVVEGDGFGANLARGYKQLVASEVNYHDWSSAERFAKKSLAAASGKEVLPEELSAKKIQAGQLVEMTHYRYQLLDLLPKIKDKEPVRAANAQVAFDCWVEQSEEGWEVKKINECKEDLLLAISGKKSYPNLIGGGYLRSVVGIPPKNYVVFFAVGAAEVSNAGDAMINYVAQTIKESHNIKLVKVSGFNDHVGVDAAKKDLSLDRANQVTGLLVKAGVDKSLIKVQSYSGELLAYPTNGQVSDARNSRVQIDIFSEEDK